MKLKGDKKGDSLPSLENFPFHKARTVTQCIFAG